jgi:hypothetical protein
LLHSGGTKF